MTKNRGKGKEGAITADRARFVLLFYSRNSSQRGDVVGVGGGGTGGGDSGGIARAVGVTLGRGGYGGLQCRLLGADFGGEFRFRFFPFVAGFRVNFGEQSGY
jgi:hypothetical protein